MGNGGMENGKVIIFLCLMLIRYFIWSLRVKLSLVYDFWVSLVSFIFVFLVDFGFWLFVLY